MPRNRRLDSLAHASGTFIHDKEGASLTRDIDDMEGLRIGDTPVGLGVFATRAFDAEEEVGEIVGQMFDDPDYASDYCVEVGPSLSLEPGPPFRFLNHSCEPNCALVQSELQEDDEVQPEEVELWVETLRPIWPGEQMTIDYGWPAEQAIPCGCTAENCRGWVVRAEEAHRLTGRSPHATSPAAAESTE